MGILFDEDDILTSAIVGHTDDLMASLECFIGTLPGPETTKLPVTEAKPTTQPTTTKKSETTTAKPQQEKNEYCIFNFDHVTYEVDENLRKGKIVLDDHLKPELRSFMMSFDSDVNDVGLIFHDVDNVKEMSDNYVLLGTDFKYFITFKIIFDKIKFHLK